jgi:putative tricarboxylic transport membrane protein
LSALNLRLKAMGTRRTGRAIAGLIGLVGFVGYLQMALDMPSGSTGNPGPGLWPTMVGYFGVAMSIMLVLEALLMANSTEGNIEFPRQEVLRRVLGFLGLSLAYILVVPVLGQLVASTLFFTVIIKLLSKKNWLIALFFGALSAVLIWAFFTQALSLRLPAGVLGIGI